MTLAPGEQFKLLQEVTECAAACVACADACLGEESVADLVACIRLNENCADICGATARMLARPAANTNAWRAQVEACAAACAACGAECERHAEMHDHCRICADVCRTCEKACREAVAPVAV